MEARRSKPAPVGTDTQQTFESCYSAHYRMVFHLGLRYGRSAAWAEDLTQDVFVKLAEHLAGNPGDRDLGGWLYRVANNLAVSRLRRERSWFTKVRVALQREQPNAVPGPDHAIATSESAARALAALRRLPPRQQVVLAMKLLDDRSQADIARTLSLSEGYVSRLVARGLEAIRKDTGYGDV